MERQRFEAPTRSKWPLVLAAIAVIAAALVAWLYVSGGAPGAQTVAAGELMGERNASEPAPRAAESRGAGMAAPVIPTADSTADPSADAATFDSLLAQADEAYDAGEMFKALPLYKEVAVRLQMQINLASDDAKRQELEAELASIKELVRDSEQGLRASVPAPDLSKRTPHAPPRSGEARELLIKELGNFPYDDEVGGVPADIAALDGSTVALTGYMLPAYQTDQIKQFTLVADVYQCCFGQPPGVEHTINVVLPEGKAVTFTYGEVQVTGTLRVEEERRDGFVINLFTLEDISSVRATGKP